MKCLSHSSMSTYRSTAMIVKRHPTAGTWTLVSLILAISLLNTLTSIKRTCLGSPPSSTDVPSELARQFIYQFVTTGNHNMDLAESYAFNGGESFTIGGTLDDYKELICAGGAADELFGNVTIQPVVIEGVFAEYNANEARTHPTYWKSKNVNPKVANYAPPMEQELLE